MKKYLLVLLLFSMLILAGCSGGGLSLGGSGPDTDEPIRGNGLEIRFTVDDDWVTLKQFSYRLRMENSGKEPVIINEEDLVFNTVQRNPDGTSVLSSASINEFYNTIFEEGPLTLYNGEEVIFEGMFEIDNSYFENLNNDNIDYSMSIKYDYITEFSNNVLINLDQKKLSIQSPLTQAAPVKVVGIDLEPNVNNDYSILYEIADRGSARGNDAKRIIVEDIDIDFGSSGVGCDPFIEESGERKPMFGDIALTNDNDKILLLCDLPTGEYEDRGEVNTITSGSFEYVYEIRTSGTVRLPSDREQYFR